MARINRKKHKQHTKYYNKTNQLLPGITTIVDLLNKPQLIIWANNLGLSGIEYYKYMNTVTDIGKLTHKMIECTCRKKKLNTDEYCKKDIEIANICYNKFFNFYKEKRLKILLSENPLVSENWQFGGTPDLLFKHNKQFIHIDFKTGDEIYLASLIQLAAQKVLIIENGYQIDCSYILRISRNKKDDYELKEISNDLLDKCFKLFNYLLEIYKIKKDIGYK